MTSLRRLTRISALTIVVMVTVSLAASARLSADDWPHWRGPFASGLSDETGLPEHWGNAENVAWKAALGGVGVSSPIVWGDTVFATSQIGTGPMRTGPRLGQGVSTVAGERSLGRSNSTTVAATHFVIEAFSRADGRRLWQHELASEGTPPPVHDKHNLASSSPVTDGNRVYAVFGTGQVVAVGMDGQRLWTRALAAEFGAWDVGWGNGSSPILHRGMLIVTAYHPSASYLIALDAATGRDRWKVDRPTGVISYSTPLIVDGPEGDELVVNSSVGIEAYDPATGHALWHYDEVNRFPIPAPLHHDGVVYLSRGYRSGPYAAIRPGGRGDISKTHVIWRAPTGAPYVSSLVAFDGLLYMAGDVGIVTCVDAKTGERVWRERLGGLYTASPVAADGKIYLMSETGETIVLRAGRTPDVIARNAIDGRILASPAIAEGQLFIRTDGEIIAVGRGG